MIQLILLLLISLPAWSTDIGLELSSKNVKQGSIVPALIKIDAASAQEVPLQKLKSKTFAETIYVYDVGTPVRKEGRPYFEADAKIIFIKVPDNNELSFSEEGKSFKVFWNPVIVTPTKTEKSFLYGAFDAPGRLNALRWVFLGAVILLLTGLGFWAKKIFQVKALHKKSLLDLKNKLRAATTYNEIVDLWMSRQLYLQSFPAIEEAFRKFEHQLFKVQFKPTQTDNEKRDVLDAYQLFLTSIKGALDGI